MKGGPNPISQEIVFFQIPAQIPNPSPSAQNPISQPLKKANPSSHFTPSRPSQRACSLAVFVISRAGIDFDHFGLK